MNTILGLNPVSFGPVFAGVLFVGMLICLEAGYRIATWRLARNPSGAEQGIGAMNGAVFGLLGLLVAFTFSGAASRFDQRRQLIVEESNDIGTAWLRVDLLPEDQQPGMRDLLRQYVDSRIETYRLLPDLGAAMTEISESNRLQVLIWKRAVAARETGHDLAGSNLVLSSLNDMFDIASTRTASAFFHPPHIIFALLFGLALGCSLLAGYSMAASGARKWVHILGFAGILALSVYVILEIEYPRLGVIRLDNADQVLVETRESMN